MNCECLKFGRRRSSPGLKLDQHCRRRRRMRMRKKRRRRTTDTEGVVTGERFNHVPSDCISTAVLCSAPLQSVAVCCD